MNRDEKINGQNVAELEMLRKRIALLKRAETKYQDALENADKYVSQLKSLIGSMSLTEETERRKFARELHENIAQLAALAKLKLTALSKSISEAGLLHAMNEIQLLINEITASLRALTFEISLPLLYELGFVPALEWLTEHIRDKYNISAEFDGGDVPELLDEKVRIILFRIIRNLLIEIAHQSKATRFRLSLIHIGHELCADIQDDGIGIDISQIGSAAGLNNGLGYIAICENLELVGGRISINSLPQGGSHIILSVPIPNKDS